VIYHLAHYLPQVGPAHTISHLCATPSHPYVADIPPEG
jgi:hypothetical protein